MKNIWVLSLRTSLPETCELFGEMTPEFYAFESFEKAKEAFRAKLKALAFQKRSSMFDGNGRLARFED